MSFISNNAARPGSILLRLFSVALLMFAAGAAQAQATSCSAFPNATLDGFVNPNPPSNINIDTNCTVRNFPASNPLTTNFSFFTQPGQTNERWLIIFDNVVHTGQMSCNSVLEHKIWFTNGSSTTIQEGCQNLLIPVEKIDKQTPPGQTTAAIGVPFTYTLNSPVLFDPATTTVINTQGSVNDLHGITIWDDLNELGVDVTFLGYTAYWETTGTPIPHSFSNVGGLLTFDNFPVVPAGEQFIIEISLVLNDTPVNAPGTQFINIARWDFGRLIDGIFYEPLPGEWGISPPLTIASPDLIVNKSGPTTLGRTLNLGEWGDFAIDVQNVGLIDAWDVTLVDLLPDGPTGGMCDTAPQIVSAQVFEADGVTPAPGKGPLFEGIDYSLSFTGAPNCEMTMTMLSPSSTIGPNERLIVNYQARLDPDSQDGAQLTNIVGATEWFNGDSSNISRIRFERTLTDGTVGTDDHEDAHTITVELRGYFFEKTVQNLRTGDYPATTAMPGDTLRYTVRLQSTDLALSGIGFLDDLGELNPIAVFVPGSLTIVPGTVPPGADASNTDPNGGTNNAGLLDIRNIDMPAYSEVQVQFDITLQGNLPNGTFVTNQADLINGIKIADSDDPFVNGQSDPDVDGDEDPTRLIIEGPPPTALVKVNTQATATIGEEFAYQVTIPSAPHTSPLYDVRVLDNLLATGAELEFVSASRLSNGTWTPVNTGTPTDLIIEDPVNGIDIPAGEQAVIEIRVRLTDTATNIAGLTFANTAAYTYNLTDNDVATVRPGLPGTTQPMTVVEPELTLEKSGPINMRVTIPETFTLNIQNVGTSPAYSLTISDVLPNQADGGMCDIAPVQINAQLYEADGVTTIGGPLVQGTDFDTTFAGDPLCTFTINTLTPAAAIGPTERLIITYDTELDANTQQDAILTNVAGATEWFGLDVITDPSLSTYARTYTRVVTDGTVGVLDHEDAHTVVEFTPLLIFEKTAVNMTTGDDPASVAAPGDTIRYTLRVENASTTPIANFNIVDELDSLNALPLFQAGTLAVVSVPAGADDTNTDANGGTAGTGLLDVRDLSLAGLGDSFEIVFDVTLIPVIANGSYVYNQSQAIYLGNPIALSDDPYVNGVADPAVAGDEDPTQLLIQSAPVFLVQKISSYLDGDPNVLLAGETLRYTITVQNVGTDHATNVDIVDLVPASTTYVLGSTTLNGVAVADVNGGSPLINGILINAPEDTTPGNMNANVADNVATIVFDVVVYPDAPDGTIISNQAFVSAVDQAVADVPSDDPRTAVPDDPTQDVVGNFPLLFAPKSAALQVDLGSPGIVDPGDVLRYTITIYNNGTVAATAAELIDVVPANTTYVPDSVTLNGDPVGQPDLGVFPLIAGIPVSSADLTPPLPGAGEGVINPGESAVVQFDLQVDAAALPGTLITNQATVYSAERGNLLTDGDGNPATGPEPTIVVVGDAQQLQIVKEVAVVGGGPALAGSILEYTVTVRNVASVPALYVVITDDLNQPNPGYLTYVDPSATMNGLTTGVSVAGNVITADYSTDYGPLNPDETIVLRFRATINPNLLDGTTITNTARATWNDPPQWAEASVSIDVGAMPNAGIISGNVWHDADHDNTFDGLEQPLDNWTVELLFNNQVVRTMLSDVDGFYAFTGVTPNYVPGETYSLRFTAPGAGVRTALLGETDSDFTDGLQRIDDIDVQEGSNNRDLNMPVDPNGVIYNSISRTPVAGATVTLVDVRNGSALPGSCFDDPNQQNQVTVANGYYKFDINFSDPLACPSDLNYLVRVTAPDSTYVPGVSLMIPPASDETTLPFDVPACPNSVDDAVLATLQHCEVQASEFAPPTTVPARSAGTDYHLFLRLDNTRVPGSSQAFNNHVPIDPRLDGAVAVTKTTPMLNVTRGQLVPYVITVSNSYGADLLDVAIIDRFPAGFRYIAGSARFDDVAAEPEIIGRELRWTGLTLATDGRHEIKLLLAVGAGVTEGEFVNRALAVNSLTGTVMSAEAAATVRIVPDPTFDCTDVTGKVYDDNNRNGFQDDGERGLAGVRVVTASGLAATTDSHGRYHFTCAITPHESRGSNIVVKLDDRTLPAGFRPSTRAVQIQRATRGKALRINFAASIHRVVGLDIADPVFEPGTDIMRHQWRGRIPLLLDELQRAPAVLRLSYVADVESEALVEQRIETIKQQIMTAWQDLNCCYELIIEPEVFWRLGGPPSAPRESGQ